MLRIKRESNREADRAWAAEQLEKLRTAPPSAEGTRWIENENEITHPPGQRAIPPFAMLSPGDSDYVTFIDRWLERHKK